VDEAKDILDELNHTLNTSQEKRNRAGTEQQQLRNELDRLNADNSRLGERDLNLSTTKQDLENQLSNMGLPVHADITVLLSDNNSLINQLKTTLDEVNALALKHRSTDQDLNRLQGDELQISDSLTQTRAKLDTNTAQWHQLHQDFTAQLAEAEAVLLRYALSIDPNNCLGHVDELRMRYDRWQQLVDRATLLSKRADDIQQDMNLRKNSLNEKELALTKLRQEQEQQQISIDEKKALRQALGVDDNPVAQRTVLTNQQQQKELALLNIRDQMAQLRENVSAIQGVLDLTNRELPRARQDKMHDEIALQALLAQHGFAHLEALRSAFLSPDQVLHLEQTLEQHKKRLAALDTEREQYLAELIVIGERNPEALPQLEASLTELEAQSTQLNREIGALEQLLRADEEAQVNSRQMLEQITVQKRAEQRWKMLSEIMGSADGNKFRSFAQGLTLQHLVNLANNHLNTLSGRYFLQRKASGLELLIVDTFQADNKRSVNSLSGGETFLVSLALALGLSDMAGKQAAIQSLFIDEGFGTLDADALDMAIDTLENLQQTGKTIGIISHIQELKERIGTQIYIQKSSHGLSSYEIKS
jgi:exonuclease SbcC